MIINKIYNSTKNNESTKVHGGSVPYITFDIFDELPVNATFSTRFGGVSKGMFRSMNFCTTLGDTQDNIRENFRLYGEATGHKKFVLSKQTHTVNVRVVDERDVDKGICLPMDYDDVDGLVTNVSGITLSTFYADCVPLYFYDKENHAIGLSHGGWKGTVNNMVASTLDIMKQEYNTNPKNIVAAIGPSICVKCYEISFDVASKFMEAFELNESDIKGYESEYKNEYGNEDEKKYGKLIDMNEILYSKKDGKYMLNLWAANYKNMINAGILMENIAVTDICTCMNATSLFSHRALNGKRGNLGAFMSLN